MTAAVRCLKAAKKAVFNTTMDAKPLFNMIRKKADEHIGCILPTARLWIVPCAARVGTQSLCALRLAVTSVSAMAIAHTHVHSFRTGHTLHLTHPDRLVPHGATTDPRHSPAQVLTSTRACHFNPTLLLQAARARILITITMRNRPLIPCPQILTFLSHYLHRLPALRQTTRDVKGATHVQGMVKQTVGLKKAGTTAARPGAVDAIQPPPADPPNARVEAPSRRLTPKLFC